jgi:hypothetical protein
VKAKYTRKQDGAHVRLEEKFKTECCDCGLVHLWELEKLPDGKTFAFKVTRDIRATAQRRRVRKQEGK